MKLSLPKPRPRATSGRAGIPMPSFVTNLMRDMRDRRLILPAIALVLAIVAVPVMLRSESEPAPAAIPFVGLEGSEEVVPAVLTEQPLGVRDYRERLKELKSKNPFAQKFQLTPEELDTATELIETPTASTTTAGSPVAGSGTTPATQTGATSPPTEPTSSEPATPPSSKADQSSDRILILAPRLELRFGKLGALKAHKDVQLGDVLPSRRKPVVSLVSVSNDLKAASFIVSSGVTGTSGDGKCSPNRNECQFLTVKEGKAHKFEYGEQGTVHRLVIDDIREKIVDRRKLKTG